MHSRMGGFPLREADISLFLLRQANGRVINLFILQRACLEQVFNTVSLTDFHQKLILIEETPMFLLVLTRGLPILITYTHYSFSKPQVHTSLSKSVNILAFLLFSNIIHISRALLSSVMLYLLNMLFHSIQLEISLHKV